MTKSAKMKVAHAVAALAVAVVFAGCGSGASPVDGAGEHSEGVASRTPCETTYSNFAEFLAASEAENKAANPSSPATQQFDTSIEAWEGEMTATIEKSFNSIPAGGQRAYLTAVCRDFRAGEYGIAETRERLLAQPATTIGMGLTPCYAPELYRTAGESEDIKDVPDTVNPDVLSASSMMWFWGIRTLCPQQYGRG